MYAGLVDPWWVIELYETVCQLVFALVLIGLIAECVCLLSLCFTKESHDTLPIWRASRRSWQFTGAELGFNIEFRCTGKSCGVSASGFPRRRAILTETGLNLDQALTSDPYLDGRR